MTKDLPYCVLAYYYFVHVENPLEEVAAHRSFLSALDATARIYISHEGINGQLCLHRDDVATYQEWMQKHPLFSGTVFKIHQSDSQVFPRLVVKHRKQLVAIDKDVDLSKRGQHVDPKQWRTMLENGAEKILIDVRNDYEWKVGRFAGAELPPCETFREFDGYAEELKTRVDPKKTPVMMYCTGGIRCELYSAILKEQGFEEVYQLNGGVIDYGLKEGSAHWLGKLYVFDDRMTVPISDEPTPIIGQCQFCQTPAEDYYNCASMDCNCLFLCCKKCLEEHKGCCQQSCAEGSRVRPYHQQNPHRPFRRRHLYNLPKRELPSE